MKLPWSLCRLGQENRKSKPSRPRLAVECLEERALPAGLDAVPVHDSNPGAPASLYLDFNGHFQDEFYGCAYVNLNFTEFEVSGEMIGYTDIDTPAFDQD